MKRVYLIFTIVFAFVVSLSSCAAASEAGAALKAALKNETALFSVNHDRSMMLDELWSLGGDEGPYMPKEYSRFSVVDMDGYGTPEIVINAGACIVLHYEDGIVYAFQFGSRSMQMLRKDGSYYGASGASSGAYIRISRFNGKTYLEEYLGEEDESEGEYKIKGKSVSKEEFDRIIAELIDKNFAEELEFTESNIEGIMAGATKTDSGAGLYAEIPDSAFPIPMLNGAPIPYEYVSLPEEGWEVTSYVYSFSGTSFMESYMEQLRKAGFVDQGSAGHIESMWRFDRSADGAALIVEMFHEESKFSINMYVNYKNEEINGQTPDNEFVALKDNFTGKTVELYPTDSDNYLFYGNMKIGYSIYVPCLVFTEVVLLPDNEDGMILGSKDGKARFRVTGGFYMDDSMFRESFNSAVKAIEEKSGHPDFEIGDESWEIIWREGDDMLHRRKQVMDREIGAWAEVEIYYYSPEGDVNPLARIFDEAIDSLVFAKG